MTQQQIDDFIRWHEFRMIELQYPEKIQQELRKARGTWLPKAKKE